MTNIVGELLADFFRPAPGGRHFPAADVYVEGGHKAVIKLAIAGYTKDNIEVKIERDLISVIGHGVVDDDDSNRKYYQKSLKTDGFTVNIPVSGRRWDLVNANASYENGILKIELGETEEEAKLNRLIEIK